MTTITRERTKKRRRVPDDGRMTVVEHLTELRRRVFISAGALLVASIVAFSLYPEILRILMSPLEAGERLGDVKIDGLKVGGITTAFVLRLKVAMFGGLILSLPVSLWQLWRFVTPGLAQKERRYGIPFVFSALLLFAGGAYVAFNVLTPAIGFLIQFAGPPLEPLIFVDQYLKFVMFMVLAFGLSFEFPLLLVSLAGVGILSSERMAALRRKAWFLCFVTGAVATPSQDPYSMLFLALPLAVLYELAYLVVGFAMRY